MVLLGASCVFLYKARALTWTGRKSLKSFMLFTFSTSAVKEEYHEYINEHEQKKIKIMFRLGGGFLVLGIWFLVLGAYVF